MIRRRLILPIVVSLLTVAACASSQPKTLSAATDQQTVTVYVTNTGKRYHRDGCRSLRKSRIPISLDDAKKKGYTACGICRPPQ